jgi:hypothetical protein
MRNIFILLTLILMAFSLNAQKTESLFGTRNFKFTGIWGGRTMHFGLPREREFYLRGGEIGFEFDKNFILGWSWQKSKEPIVPLNNQAAFNFKNRGVFISYVPGSTKVIHPRFNFSAGSSLATTTDKIKERGINFSPSIGIEANLLSWLKISAEGGYRIHSDFRTPALLQNSLTGSFFQVQIRYGSSWNKSNHRDRWD